MPIKIKPSKRLTVDGSPVEHEIPGRFDIHIWYEWDDRDISNRDISKTLDDMGLMPYHREISDDWDKHGSTVTVWSVTEQDVILFRLKFNK